MRTLLITGGMLTALAVLASTSVAGKDKLPDNVPPKGFTALFDGTVGAARAVCDGGGH